MDYDIPGRMGAAKQPRKLLKETEWSRRYLVGENHIYYESKFLADKLEVDAEKLIKEWAGLSSSDRREFVHAFQSKPQLSPNDEKILDFLMMEGDESVWRTISLMLCRHSDREAVIQFTMMRIEKCTDKRANYYQAAEVFGDSRFTPVLERQFEEYRRHITLISETSSTRVGKYREYLQLCKTLGSITGNQNYLEIIRGFLNDPSEFVRNKARLLLESSEI